MTLPPIEALLESLSVVSIPLTVRFRGVTMREAALLRGPEGWTEFSPFLEYQPHEAATWLAAAIDYGWARQPKAVRATIPINATVPAVAAAEVPAVLANYSEGFGTVKVKVAERGQTLADDVARVAAVRRDVGDRVALRVDANGGWTLDEAFTALAALSRFDLEYAEQPVAAVDDLARLHDALSGSILIAADESIRKATDPMRVSRLGAADLIVVKAQPLGGIGAGLEIVRRSGLPAVVSSALDTNVGLSMGAHLAACMPELPYACGLGTGSLFSANVAAPAVHDGAIGVGRPEVDEDAVARLAAAPPRVQWWRDRVRQCYDVLAARQSSSYSPE